MGLSHYALQHMGFRRRHDDERYSASFFSVVAYEVQGVSTSQNLLVDAGGVIGGVNYRIALSDSLNVAARKVAADDFADDEQAWAAEHDCLPPYLVIYVGPTTLHAMTGEFLKEGAGPLALDTYQGFVPAYGELRGMEQRVMPPLLSALSCTFGASAHVVRFRELERAVIGETPEGITVRDISFQFRAEGRVSKSVALLDLQDILDRAIPLAIRMSPKVSRLFSLALNESDPLKRFLYLFLTIERETNAVFKTVDHCQAMAALTQVPERIKSVGESFFEAQPANRKTLRDKFIWCALTVWTHLTDADVESFLKVKKVRDQIAHGEISAPPTEAIQLVERVAATLQLAP